MKKIIIIVIVVVIAIPILAFLPFAIGRTIYYIDYYYNDPQNFPGSVWSTENGEITFKVNQTKDYLLDENGDVLFETNMVGKINLAGINKKCFMGIATNEYVMVWYSEISIDSKEYDSQHMKILNYKLASFNIDYISNKHFKATVTDSPVYEVGTVFDFYRTDN